jgi:methylenetetrahydrofolate reductase (NADPH)
MTVAQLARQASLEFNCLETLAAVAAREWLWPGQRVYVSHLPGQSWEQTWRCCTQVAMAGFDPVPHIPVRLLDSERQLNEVLSAARGAGAQELLLIAGDYAEARGPYSSVLQVLHSGRLQPAGFTRVSLAGHPEGHPGVPATEIRRAEVDKARAAAALGLEVSILTQFFFAAEPFVQWARELREAGVQARLVAGLPGPAGIAKLLRLARHCGVGPSLRALTSRPSSMLRLVTDHAPDDLLRNLAEARRATPGLFDGIHVFSFGGFLRTATWLRQTAQTS